MKDLFKNEITRIIDERIEELSHKQVDAHEDDHNQILTLGLLIQELKLLKKKL